MFVVRLCVQGTVGTSVISSVATTTPAKPQPGGSLAAQPPAKDGTPVQGTPGGRTLSVRRPFVRPFKLLRCCSRYCSSRGAKLLPAAAEGHDAANAFFRLPPGAPSSLR